MHSGKLAGCQLIFEALAKDWKYRQGALLKIEGSVAVMLMKSQLGTSLKVVVQEMTVSKDLDVSFSPSSPSRAYLIADNLNTSLGSLVAATPSDTPGALFSVFNLSPTLDVLVESLDTKTLKVAFNQLDGESDIVLTLNTDVAETDATGRRTKSNEAMESLSACLLALSEQNQPSEN
ncbi:hypothetical protein J2Y63_001386 [Shinella sp. BE166]|uniref:hypothetical protein n=1 Tax=Shinella sp. BE166 TaxID=3373918 RepID=UPI003EB95912